MSSNKKYYLSECLMIKNENQYLHEHIVSDMEAGIDHFYIYDDRSDVPVEEYLKNNYPELLDYCTITVVDDSWINPIYDEKQRSIYNRFLDDYGDETVWCSITDTDEIWEGDLKKFCKEAEESGVYRIFVPWTIHGCNGHIFNDGNPFSLKERFVDSVISLIDFPLNKLQELNMYCGKSIVYCDKELNKGYHLTVHVIIPSIYEKENLIKIDDDWVSKTDYDYWSDIVNKYKTSDFRLNVTLHHYFFRSVEEYLVKMLRGYKHISHIVRDNNFLVKWEKEWSNLDRFFHLNNLDPNNPDIQFLLKKYNVEFVSVYRHPSDYTVSYSDLVENPDSSKVKKYKRIVERLNKKYNNEHTNNRNIGIYREESSKENN